MRAMVATSAPAAGRQDDPGVATVALAGGFLLQALLVERLEVDLRQVHRRQAGALDRVRNVRPQVGIDDVRADDVEQHRELVVGNAAYLEDPGFLRLDEEEGLLAHFRRDGDGDEALVDAVGDGLAADVELDLDLRTLLLEEDAGRMRHLEREILQVDALDRENRTLGLLGHFGSWLGAGGMPAGLRVGRALVFNASGLQQRRELAATIQGMQVVATADMDVADEDLRHGRAARALDHLAASFRLVLVVAGLGVGR